METATNTNVETNAEFKGTPHSSEGDRARRLEYLNWAALVLGALISVYWKDKALTLSFLAGAGLSAFNFRLLRHIVTTLCGGRITTKKKLVAQIALKFVGGLGFLTLIMLVFEPKPIPFLLGLSTLVLVVGVEGVLGLFQKENG